MHTFDYSVYPPALTERSISIHKCSVEEDADDFFPPESIEAVFDSALPNFICLDPA